MPTLNLKNITIKKLEDRNLNPYHLIVNRDNQDEAFFCFEKTVKEGWDNLVNNWENLKEVEIGFTENENNFKTYRKVVSLYAIPQPHTHYNKYDSHLSLSYLEHKNKQFHHNIHYHTYHTQSFWGSKVLILAEA